jgi:hypothetical protein
MALLRTLSLTFPTSNQGNDSWASGTGKHLLELQGDEVLGDLFSPLHFFS